MDLNLKGKKALVTGASSGLGYAAALALANEGAEIIINSFTESKLVKAGKKISDETGVTPKVVAADLSTADGIKKVEAALPSDGVDILVANSGGPLPGQFTEKIDSDWDGAHNLVLSSAKNLTKIVIDKMIERKWGRLIYITSIGALQPIDDLILSNTYRAGVTAMSRTLANTYAKYGITSNCVCPGFTATERLTELAEKRAEQNSKTIDEVFASFASMVPAGRIGKPDELANLITFLASEKASYINGTSIPVDGGYVRGLI